MGQRPAYRKVQGIQNGSFIRVGDQDQRMPAAMLYEIDAFKAGIRDDASVLAESTSDMFDERRVSDYVRRAQENRANLTRRTPEEVLLLTGAIKDNKPTLAGTMTLSDYPQQTYPNLCITAIAVDGEQFTQLY